MDGNLDNSKERETDKDRQRTAGRTVTQPARQTERHRSGQADRHIDSQTVQYNSRQMADINVVTKIIKVIVSRGGDGRIISCGYQCYTDTNLRAQRWFMMDRTCLK